MPSELSSGNMRPLALALDRVWDGVSDRPHAGQAVPIFPYSGEEQSFDLVKDRQELHDLSKGPASGKRVKVWRNRLIRLLGRRGDGFSDGRKLLVRNDRWGPDVGK